MRCSDATAAYLRLASIHGIGPKTGRQLVSACGSVSELWNLPPRSLEAIEGVTPRLVKALGCSSEQPAERILKQCKRHDIDILCPEDRDYPGLLNACDDAPLILYLKGDVSALNRPRMLAMVGARKASRESRLIARRWSASCSRSGVSVVSGMAYGVDAAAHGGALESESPTIAVLGSGIAALNETQRQQAEAVAGNGCVVSEYSPETGGRAEHFPQRNRIIAGLSHATVVIEAGLKSGSMITAGYAAAYGRDVFAVPGSVLTETHQGCHQLIRDGAELADSVEQILRSMGWESPSAKAYETYTPASSEEEKVIRSLKQEIMHLDRLAEACNLTVPELSPCLLALELQGIIERLPGSRFALGGRIHERSRRGGVTR